MPARQIKGRNVLSWFFLCFIRHNERSRAGAGAPLITVEFHNAGNDMETVVRNTYDEEKGLPGQNGFIFSTASKKEGHEGLGLKAVKDILKEKPGSVCNLYLHGRFVEASLLIG